MHDNTCKQRLQLSVASAVMTFSLSSFSTASCVLACKVSPKMSLRANEKHCMPSLQLAQTLLSSSLQSLKLWSSRKSMMACVSALGSTKGQQSAKALRNC